MLFLLHAQMFTVNVGYFSTSLPRPPHALLSVSINFEIFNVFQILVVAIIYSIAVAEYALCCYEAKRHNLKLKTVPKQLLGSIPLAFAFHDVVQFSALSDEEIEIRIVRLGIYKTTYEKLKNGKIDILILKMYF
jgi:hypothetical protein